MEYNDMFRVFDNGGKTIDRYTVFLANDPEEGALGLSDNPTHPQGFSQWGDADLSVVERRNEEIPFDQLPSNVQSHVIERFGVQEGCNECQCDCDTCDCGCDGKCGGKCDPECVCTKEEKINEVWKQVVASLMENDKDVAAYGVSALIKHRVRHLMEFKNGALKITGDDIYVNGKKVGEFENDLSDMKHGIIIKLDDGEEAEVETVPEFFKFLMDKFRIKEGYLVEATGKQKAIVKSLRKLAKDLGIKRPRFRSSPGKAGFVELSTKDPEESPLPNSLRKRAVVKVLNGVPTNFDDVKYGNIMPGHMTLTADQWEKLLSYYNLDIPELL